VTSQPFELNALEKIHQRDEVKNTKLTFQQVAAKASLRTAQKNPDARRNFVI
jgi:hypothetical protein